MTKTIERRKQAEGYSQRRCIMCRRQDETNDNPLICVDVSRSGRNYYVHQNCLAEYAKFMSDGESVPGDLLQK
jgi:hypothetical protein